MWGAHFHEKSITVRFESLCVIMKFRFLLERITTGNQKGHFSIVQIRLILNTAFIQTAWTFKNEFKKIVNKFNNEVSIKFTVASWRLFCANSKTGAVKAPYVTRVWYKALYFKSSHTELLCPPWPISTQTDVSDLIMILSYGWPLMIFRSVRGWSYMI